MSFHSSSDSTPLQVLKVDTAIMLGKTKRNYLFQRSLKTYKKGDWKKAYVTLNQDFKYPDLEFSPGPGDPKDRMREEVESKWTGKE